MCIRDRYELMKEFPYCLTAEREERIVMVLNLTRASAAPGSFRQDFALFIREGNFRAGYSNLFHGLEQLEVYYRQAGIAPVSYTHLDVYKRQVTTANSLSYMPIAYCVTGFMALQKTNNFKDTFWIYAAIIFVACVTAIVLNSRKKTAQEAAE